MKKETSIAIIFGLILGGIVAFFIIFQNRNQQMQQSKAIGVVTTITPTILPQKTNNDTNMTVTVDEPTDNLIVTKNSVTIKGKAPKNSLVVIESPIKDLSFTTTTDSYSTSFPLALGENAISVSAYVKTQQQRIMQKLIKVYYLNEE